MRTNEAIDERIRALVAEAVAEIGVGSEEQTGTVINAVMDKILPVCGAKALRRQTYCDMRAAFKEGFHNGKVLGRYARWHTQLFSQSSIAKALREPANDRSEGQSRYAKYNFD